MTAFRFRARGPDARRLTGTVSAASPESALATLNERGLTVTGLAPLRGSRGIPDQELGEMLHGFAALLACGLPVDRALHSIEQSSRPRFRPLIADGRARILAGGTVAASLEGSGLIDPVTAATLRAGELRGRLADVAAEAATALTVEAELKAALYSALLYPAFLIVCGLSSVALVGGVILPKFGALLGDGASRLPVTTRLVFAAGELAKPSVILVAFGLPVLALTLFRIQFPLVWDACCRAAQSIPLAGRVMRRWAAVRICRSLASQVRSGVPIPTALELAAAAAGNTALAGRIRLAREDVLQGARLSGAFRRHQVLPGSSQLLLDYGDETGRPADFLARAADLEDRRLQRDLRGAIALVEPALVVLIGGAIALVALGILQALYGVSPAAL